MYNFYNYFGNYHNVYAAILLIACIGVLISSLEYLVIHKEFKTDGVFSWKIFSSRPDYINNARFVKKFDFLFGYTGFLIFHILRILCCLVLPFVETYPLKALLVSIIAISSLIFSYRNIIGTDGSDQMNSVIFITFFITFLANDEFIFKTGLIFIACQSIMSYVIAGIAKIRGPKWRKGAAVFQIMNTKTYGHKRVAVFLAKAPMAVNYILCWKIILIETTFFLTVFLPCPWFFIYLIWGIVFHFYNAIAMGLNNFFWAFLATYPAIIFLNYLI